MMRKSSKLISLILVFTLIVTSSLTGCSGGFGGAIRDFFDGIFDLFRRYQVVENARMPDRPFILKEEDAEGVSIASFLDGQDVTAEQLLADDELAGQLLNAGSLEDIADSKGQWRYSC